MSKAATKQKGAAFGDLGDMMGMSGMDSVLSVVTDAGKPSFSTLDHDDIKIYAQQRNADEMEAEDQTLDELAANIQAQGVLQPIIVCKNEDGPEQWRLVAGERRLRASILAGLSSIPAMCYDQLTGVQIFRIQLAENNHRLNLSQINEAQVLQTRLQEEFDGDVEALADAINKSRSWISKRLALLDLPTETQRLVTEGITADIEVINTVKTVEKIDPEAAKEAVNTLKDETGKKGANARNIAKEAKDKVKPPKPKKNSTPPPINPENVATPKDRSHEESGPVTSVEPAGYTFGDALAFNDEQEQPDQYGAAEDELHTQQQEEVTLPLDTSKVPALPPTEALSAAFTNIFEFGADPKMLLSTMPAEQRDSVENWLHSFYDAGANTPTLAQAVIQGFRSGQFDTEGHGAFAMAAFLTGADSDAKFNLLDIMGSVKA